VTLVVSGFLSELEDNGDQWMSAAIQDPSQVFYNVQWRANQIYGVVTKYLGILAQ